MISAGEYVPPLFSRTPPFRGMLATDLDGTLLGSDRALSAVNRATLEALGRHDIARVVATGRNTHSFNRAVGSSLPIDFAVLSSGVAVIEYPSGTMVRSVALEPEKVDQAAQAMLSLDVDFVIHDPVPDNHHFRYHASSSPCDDFQRRIGLYDGFSRSLEADPKPIPAAQLIAIEPTDSGRDVYAQLKRALPGFSVVRTTSPLGGAATWVEVFPQEVSKSKTTSWLAEQLGLTAKDVLTVGNDYNDQDLLEWGGTSYVVENSPSDLRRMFPTVAGNDAGGVRDAVARWERAAGIDLG